MGDMNLVVLEGTVTGAPKYRVRQRSGDASLDFRVSSAPRAQDGSDRRGEFPCVAFGETATALCELSKGDRVVLRGRLSSRRRTDAATGRTYSIVEVFVGEMSIVG